MRRTQPAAYLKICALLVPREMKVEHSGGVKAMTDEQLEAGIEAIQAMLEQRAGRPAKVIEGTAETVALPAPDVVADDKPKRPNKVMDAADTAIGPKERKPEEARGRERMNNRQDAVFEELRSATAPSTVPSARPGRRWKNTGRGGEERRKREAQIKWLRSRIGAANDPWIQAQIAKLKNQRKVTPPGECDEETAAQR